MLWYVLGAVAVTLVISIPVTAVVATNYRKKYVEGKLGDAETKAREIIDEALKTAEAKKRESLLEVKEESIRTKNELDKDKDTIFRYSNHENTILREIHKQLENSHEEDKEELQAFIESITHYKDGKDEFVGKRDMVDLADVVLKYYFHPIMGGSYSIKVVLPSVLNSSGFIQSKYSQPIYGTSEMPSQNLSEAKVWIDYGEDGKVKNPYKLLPPIASYLGIDADLNELELKETESVANGGAALAAYAKMQFSDAAMSEALEKALLTYCELDTLAMVFIWEYFHNECNK
mgnify:CR=1 FL=1